MDNHLIDDCPIDNHLIDDCICNICYENIINEFCILNCPCKTSFYHNKCFYNWSIYNLSCPMCRKHFRKKPLPLKILNRQQINDYNGDVFAVNYNILRIMSGMHGLTYTS